MIYIYRRASSTGARQLAEALGGIRSKNHARLLRKVRAGDLVVCWGDTLQLPNGVKSLNNIQIRSKFSDAEKLREQNVATIQVSRARPVVQQGPAEIPADPAIDLFRNAQELAGEFASIEEFPNRGEVFRQGVGELERIFADLSVALARPAPVAQILPPVPAADWIGRSNNHVGGNDLLNPIQQPDYWVKKEILKNEYRVHSFDGVSIRAGKKTVRDGHQNPHPWIRSWDGGWRISYDGASVKQRHRDIAHAAIKALGLTFGAVDIGEREDGSLLVLEVNRAPGLEGGTIESYARKIREAAQP